MDMYALQRLAHTEHDLMVRSLPTLHDDEVLLPPEPSRWSRLVAGLGAVSRSADFTAQSAPPGSPIPHAEQSQRVPA